MNIKKRITVACISMGVISVMTGGYIIGNYSIKISEQTTESLIKDHLISVREIKKTQIESYFGFIQNQIKTFSNDRMIIDAMQEFGSAFHMYSSEVGDYNIERGYSELSNYYEKYFLNMKSIF